MSTSEEYLQMEKLLSWVEMLKFTNRLWSESDSTELASLESIGDSFNTYAGRVAHDILNEHYNQNWFIPPAIGGDWSPRSTSTPGNQVVEREFISIYPNPASSIITVNVNLARGVGGYKFEVFDSQGRIVYETSFDFLTQYQSINISSWASGTYLWHLSDGHSFKSGNFIVSH